MRTGSIGNRDAETLINTLVEPKRSALASIRKALIALGYEEEAGYDPINIESYVSYSICNTVRFIFKHKWELVILLIVRDEKEKSELIRELPDVSIERNEDDGKFWARLDPILQNAKIVDLARTYVGKK